MTTLEPGLIGEAEREVTEELTAARWGSGLVPVLGTPALVALMEQAAVTALEGHLPAGKTSVGVQINAHHLAATPVGMRVRARAQLVKVDGRRLTFHIEAWDEIEKVGEATHERVIVDQERFLRRVEEKQE
ncbi:MAG TPA: thioesterase family protein [Thermoflexia bacterium]|jgi:predicted thioesterase|nr:thioesterase family protein [Thermoflexia bacterium]